MTPQANNDEEAGAIALMRLLTDSHEHAIDDEELQKRVAQLVDAGANPSLCVKTPGLSLRTNSIIIAAGAGMCEVLRVLLSSPHADPLATDEAGDTALLDAANADEDECARMLAGVSAPDAQNKNGFTALMFAAVNENSILCALLATITNLDIVSKDGKTARDYAASSGSGSVAAIIDAAKESRDLSLLLGSDPAKRLASRL